MSRRGWGTTRRDPRKGIKDSVIPTAGSLPGGAVTSGFVAPEYLGSGTRDGTKFLRDDGTWQNTGGGGGVGARGDVVVVTGSLTDGTTEDGVIALGKSFIALRIEVDVSARVRLYKTPAYRTADAARPIGTDPEGEHGVILDVFLDGSTGLVWDLTNMPPDGSMEATPSADIAYAITNRSGVTGTVELTVTRILLES